MSRPPAIELDTSFPHRYDAKVTGWHDTLSDVRYFPARPELIVEVQPKRGQTWKGAFGHRGGGEGFITGLFTCPDPESLCVVCAGEGYLIEAKEPDVSMGVECAPIRFVLPFPSHNVLVFGNFTEFVAYGKAGEDFLAPADVVWRSARLGWDDLEVLRVTEDRIEGQAWHAPEDKMVGFSVDVRTGEHEGGAYEELEPVEDDEG